ncbi:PEP-CTERM sorting domain-containing protein [bacterium]|nr:MAG: PEP-CTERM sorting domain-containing protein [bacterium]
MKNLNCLRVSSLVFALTAALSAHATVITFEGLPVKTDFGTYITYVSPFTTQGYTFSSIGEYATWTPTSDAGTIFSNYTGSAALFENLANDTTLIKDGGGAFNLLSIDVANVYRQGVSGSTTITFTGTLTLGGTVSQSYDIPADNPLHTVVLSGFTGLSSVLISSPDNAYQFDNVNVEAVPEPASMAALGLGALALLRRKRS